VNCAVFTGSNDTLLMTGSYDKLVRIFDLRGRSVMPVQTLQGAKDSVSDILAPSSSARVHVASIDEAVRTYDVRRGEVSVDDLGASASSLSLSRDGACLLCACLDSCLRLLDIASGELLAAYTGHRNADYKIGCAVLHDDSAVVAGSEDGRLCVWDLADAEAGTRQSEVGSPGSALSAVCAHPSRPTLLSGSHDGTVLVWTSAPQP
jgi:mitogen-activated protein kinase organizer 1